MFDDIFANVRDWLGLEVHPETDISSISSVEPENVLYSGADIESNYSGDMDVANLSAEGEEQSFWMVEKESLNDYRYVSSYSSPDENVQGFGLASDFWNMNSMECYVPETDWNPSQFDGFGDPIQEAQFWHEQTSPTSCALVAQTNIYESITGEHLSEDEICRIAEANCWYSCESGTPLSSVGNILNALGVPTEQRYEATLVDVAEALERGNKVIVGLDANEIWTPLRDATTDEPIEQSDAGHAVWVTGIDQEPDGSVKIILNDSGNPDGQMNAVDAKDFLNAWYDFGNFLAIAYPPVPRVLV